MLSITFNVADTTEEKVTQIKKRERDDEEKEGGVVVKSSDPPGHGRNVKCSNGFVETVCAAYNHHHHLVLRPDDVWIAILVQFAAYMGVHAEALREHFVTHSGQKELVVNGIGSLKSANYADLSVRMTDKIAANLKDSSIRDWALPSFSTTTPTDRVVGAIALMSSLKVFFTYKFHLMCGIPRVTLMGTRADWEALEARAKRLLEFDSGGMMTKWYALLGPVLAQFAASARGEADAAWWNRVCHYSGGGSGPTYLSGWITAFCVFNDAGEWVGDKTDVRVSRGELRYGEGPPVATGWPYLDTQNIPSGACRVDVTVEEQDGTKHACELTAGHVSTWVPEPTQVQPWVSWVLTKK